MTELICIVCPKGCHLTVDEDNGCAVTGNACVRGSEYGKAELIAPTRIVTSTVRLTGGAYPRCPVKTDGAIPKGKIADIMKIINSAAVCAPVAVGQVIAADVCGTGVSIVATRSMPLADENQ